jgi:DNA repair protein RadC
MNGTGNNGHRQRLREKYKRNGCQCFFDYELLELLLTYAIARRDVKPLAKRLLENFKTMEAILQAESTKLSEIEGIGVNTILFFHLIRDISTKIYEERLYHRDVISIASKKDLLAYLRNHLAFDTVENFMVLFLDIKNRLITSKILFTGTIDKSAVYPREIIKDVLQYEAKSVIFAHNHPSGNTDPSLQDKEFTMRMHQSLKEIEINLIDHIIISRGSYFSFLEYGNLK